ncbi:hypothetical protein J6590_050323 [Homalodisca vitripennis]|nr:hypothetical protein J6590_050323 [Homalodisca vitripennis]
MRMEVALFSAAPLEKWHSSQQLRCKGHVPCVLYVYLCVTERSGTLLSSSVVRVMYLVYYMCICVLQREVALFSAAPLEKWHSSQQLRCKGLLPCVLYVYLYVTDGSGTLLSSSVVRVIEKWHSSQQLRCKGHVPCVLYVYLCVTERSGTLLSSSNGLPLATGKKHPHFPPL